MASSNTPEIISVVIENGSGKTRAGFSNEQLPSLVFPTPISQNNETKEYIVGDEVYQHPDNEIYTILNEGVVYNWEALEQNWRSVYNSLKIPTEEFPLAITEELWNNKKNRLKLAEIAFEKLKVPVLTILKSPVSVTYGLGRSTSLVVDIGSSTVSITPIYEGTILYKGSVYSKFAGDYLNLHILNYLNKFKNIENLFNGSDSFKKLKTNELITDFKSTILNVSNFPIANSNVNYEIASKNYQLPDGTIIEIGKEQQTLVEPLFSPLTYSLPDIKLPDDSLGLTELILSGLKKLDVSTDVYNQLLRNIVITGGSSLFPGFEIRLANELARVLPKFDVQIYANPIAVERANAVWLGASILTSMNSFENHYLSKEQYEEQGEEIVNEIFK